MGSQSLEVILGIGVRFRVVHAQLGLRRDHVYRVEDVQVTHTDKRLRTPDDFFVFSVNDETSGEQMSFEGLRDDLSSWFINRGHILLMPNKMARVQADLKAMPSKDILKDRLVIFIKEHPGLSHHEIMNGMGIGPDSLYGNAIGAALSILIKQRVLWSVKKKGASADGKTASVFYASATHKPPKRSSRFEDSF